MQMEAVFPLPLNALWKLLYAHLDGDRIREIHPWMMDSRTVREEGVIEFNGLAFPRERVAERVLKVAGRRSRTTWRYLIEPPTRFDYETVFENGSRTLFDNAYAPVEGGTLVKTTGEISIKHVPSFIAMWLVNRSLDRTDEEDLAYARKMKL